MSQRSSKFVIYGAITANAAITASKFIAAAVTGSSAMLAEGIHSLVDTADTLLLLLGIHLSQRPPDAAHPFGHGRELYFWTLIVAVIIFGVGGGMGIYEGITHIRQPTPQESPIWNYIVLALATVFDGTSWIVSFRELRRSKPPQMTLFRYILHSKDPSVYTVLAEDSADLLGIAAAFFGVLLGHTLREPRLDGFASVVIGLILAAVAVFLAIQTRGLLVGESVQRSDIEQIRLTMQRDPDVERVGDPLTMYLGPSDAMLNVSIRFRQNLHAADLDHVITRLETAIRQINPDIHRVFIEPSSLESEQAR